MKNKFKGLFSRFKKKSQEAETEHISDPAPDDESQVLGDDEEYEWVEVDEDEDQESPAPSEKHSISFFSKLFKKLKKTDKTEDTQVSQGPAEQIPEFETTPPLPTEEATQKIDSTWIKQPSEEYPIHTEGPSETEDNEPDLHFDEMPRPKSLSQATQAPKSKRFATFMSGLKSKLSWGRSKQVQLEDKTQQTQELQLDPTGTMDLKSRVQHMLHNFDPQSVVEVCQKLLSPAYRGKVNHLFMISCLAALSYGSGKIAALILKGDDFIPASPISIDTDQLRTSKVKAIVANNLFNALLEPERKDQVAKKEPKKPVFDKNAICLEAKQNSSLPIKLMNTIVLQDTVKSVASIEASGQKEKVLNLREGDKIAGLASIGRIGRLEIIVRNLKSGQCEKIINQAKIVKTKKQLKILDPDAGQRLIEAKKPQGIQNEGNKYTISRKLIKDKMASINEILTQARAIQVENPDGSLSFKLTEIEPGSIYNFIGLENEDKITHINGKPIANLNEIFNLFGKIQKVNDLSVTLQRAGEETVLDYSISDK